MNNIWFFVIFAAGFIVLAFFVPAIYRRAYWLGHDELYVGSIDDVPTLIYILGMDAIIVTEIFLGITLINSVSLGVSILEAIKMVLPWNALIALFSGNLLFWARIRAGECASRNIRKKASPSPKYKQLGERNRL